MGNRLTKAEPMTMVEVPRSMMELANRRGSGHLVKYRSIEENMGAAYLQGFHDALTASGALASRALEHKGGERG